MSKIEEALRRARVERSAGAQAAGAETVPPASGERQAKGAGEPRRRELVGVTAADQIARMRDEYIREPEELDVRRIIQMNMEDSRVLDAFRHLRTSVFRLVEEKNFVLMVTSVTGDGGSSFVALNLGAAIAFDDGKTAMVLDCNLQNPSLDELIPQSDQIPLGLTDYLTGRELSVEKIIHPIGVPRLRLVPAGQRGNSAMEYFTAPRLTQLLKELRQRYRERSIIIDAPPVTEAADARILAELCDYVLLVVPYGRVTAAQVAAAASAIGKDKLIGCVMNNERRMPLLG